MVLYAYLVHGRWDDTGLQGPHVQDPTSRTGQTGGASIADPPDGGQRRGDIPEPAAPEAPGHETTENPSWGDAGAGTGANALPVHLRAEAVVWRQRLPPPPPQPEPSRVPGPAGRGRAVVQPAWLRSAHQGRGLPAWEDTGTRAPSHSDEPLTAAEAHPDPDAPDDQDPSRCSSGGPDPGAPAEGLAEEGNHGAAVLRPRGTGDEMVPSIATPPPAITETERDIGASDTSHEPAGLVPPRPADEMFPSTVTASPEHTETASDGRADGDGEALAQSALLLATPGHAPDPDDMEIDAEGGSDRGLGRVVGAPRVEAGTPNTAERLPGWEPSERVPFHLALELLPTEEDTPDEAAPAHEEAREEAEEELGAEEERLLFGTQSSDEPLATSLRRTFPHRPEPPGESPWQQARRRRGAASDDTAHRAAAELQRAVNSRRPGRMGPRIPRHPEDAPGGGVPGLPAGPGISLSNRWAPLTHVQDTGVAMDPAENTRCQQG